jgi:hypothetical protein
MLLITAESVQADYLVNLTSQGASSAAVQVGGALELDVMLTADGGSVHSSADLRVVFSASGLSYRGYLWTLPYTTASGDDASRPGLAALPVVLGPGTVQVAGTGSEAVDLYLSNLIAGPESFGGGRLVRLQLAVPADYAGPERIVIQAEVQALADGFRVVPARAGVPFELRVVPTAGPVLAPLSVTQAGALTTLSWPAVIKNATLETSSDLADPASWVAVAGTPSLEEGAYRVTLPTASNGLPVFFRLRFN